MQFINAIAWGIIAYYGGVALSIMCFLMIWVGLMGGTVYANVVYMIIEDEKIAQGEKEVSMNLLNIANFMGIILGALISMILVNTIY
jgi:CLN3 protein.